MKILIIHANMDLETLRRTSFNHAFFLPKYAPEHRYSLHCYGRPVTKRLREARYDAIILDTTFLCWRWAQPRERYFDRILEDYRFVEKSDAVKIALPQDEYDHSELLDEWLATWRIDIVYSVCYAHRALFYPRAAKIAEIREGLTGFVDEADIDFAGRTARPFEARSIDVSYRARHLPAQFGRFGQLKAQIGERFVRQFSKTPLKLDISLQPGDVVAGDEWLRFLGDSRFSLGSESGSSLLDPRGEIRDRIGSFVTQNPDATFDEIEVACFPGEDGRHIFSAISPRMFETTMARSCNILVPGSYLGVLNPDEHYIPLAPDLSNAEEVYAEMQDTRRVKERIDAAYATLIKSPRFRYSTFASDVLEGIEQHGRKKNLAAAETSSAAVHTGDRCRSVEQAQLSHMHVVQMVQAVDEASRDIEEVAEAWKNEMASRITETEAVMEDLRKRLDAVERAVIMRTGPIGAVRELLGINRVLLGQKEPTILSRIYLSLLGVSRR